MGKYLATLNNKVKYITVGNLAKEIGEILKSKGFDVTSFETNEKATCYILENLNNSYTIFLKASRSMKFEQILEDIKKRDI